MKRLTLAAMLLCLSSSAFAYFYDGNTLVTWMREDEKANRGDPNTNYVFAGWYSGYVTGVYDSLGSSLCSGGRASVRQVTAIVEQYMNAHPEEWSAPASELVAKALFRAFPCRK
jgi:hypothetical protein